MPQYFVVLSADFIALLSQLELGAAVPVVCLSKATAAATLRLIPCIARLQLCSRCVCLSKATATPSRASQVLQFSLALPGSFPSLSKAM